jgi:hypothetical protein
MSKAKAFFGLTAACIACCAAPLAAPAIAALVAGLGLAGIGAFVADWGLAILGLAVVAVATMLALRRRTTRRCAVSGS